jgi:hypothetical protein
MIISNGLILLDKEWFSSYQLGWTTKVWISDARSDFWPEYTEKQNMGLLHYQLVRRYMRDNEKILYKWLDETKTSYGGLIGTEDETIIGWLHSIYPVNLLLVPNSIEETAFKMCFEIKVRNP